MGGQIVTCAFAQQIPAPPEPFIQSVLPLFEQPVLLQYICHLANGYTVLGLHDAVRKVGFGLEFGNFCVFLLDLFLLFLNSLGLVSGKL